MSDYSNFIKGLVKMEDSQMRHLLIKDKLEAENVDNEQMEERYEEIHNDFVAELEAQLQVKVLKMVKQSSIVSRGIMKSTITNWFLPFVGGNRKDAEETINSFIIEKKEPEFYTIGNLLERGKNNKNKYIVKGLIPRGDLFLLVAAPKIGKSLMATSLALSVIRQKPFLNRETDKGKVLYIQNEENLETTTVGRIHSHGLQHLELENPTLYNELIHSEDLLVSRNLDIVLDQDLIVQKVKENNISLVIIDSLGASTIRSGLSELDPRLSDYLYKLQNSCHMENFTCIILHHATKMDAEGDRQQMMSGVAGSNRLLRANGGIIRLFADKQRENLLSFHTIPREGEPVHLKISIQKEEACYWYYEVEKESALSEEVIQLQNEILSLLYERYYQWVNEQEVEIELLSESERRNVHGLTLAELMELTSQPRQTVVARLNDMKTTEAIEFRPSQESRAFIYSIHYSGESWMSVYLDAAKEKLEKEQKQEEEKRLYVEGIKLVADELKQLIATDNLEEAKLLIKELSITERRDINSELNNEEKKKLLLFFNPPKYKVGDRVYITYKEVEGTITNIEYVAKAEKGYHNYYIDDYEKPFTIDQLNEITS